MTPLEQFTPHEKAPKKTGESAGMLDRNKMSELFKMAQLSNQPEWFPKHLHITIDDGPYPHHLKKILRVLARHKVKATFFLIGSMIDSQYKKDPEGTRDLLLRLLNEGHEIGYHSYDHCHVPGKKICKGETFETLTTEYIEDDIKRFKETLDKALGICYIVKTGRTPGGKGRTRRAVNDAFKNQNLEIHKHWHDEPARRKIYPKRYHKLEKDRIILFHQKEETARELDHMLRTIHETYIPPKEPSPNPPSSQEQPL